MSALAEYIEAHIGTPEPHLYPVTVADYHRMDEVGIIDVTQRTELIEGSIIIMAPIGSEHADWVNRLNRFFIKALSDDITVAVQNPVYLSDTSEPEPDIALLRFRQQPYRDAHPRSEDLLLVIEVADTSLDYDRNVKIPLYAKHGIPEVWLLDVAANRLEIYREPMQEEYRVHLKPRPQEIIALFAAAEIQVELGLLFS